MDIKSYKDANQRIVSRINTEKEKKRELRYPLLLFLFTIRFNDSVTGEVY
jgi:hypothetical protein